MTHRQSDGETLGEREGKAYEDPPTGELIGPYEVLSDVARGGMASVLRVRDTRSGDVCALKLLLP